MKQSEDEGLLDYTRQFKEARDVLKSIVGKKFLEEFIEHMKEYKDTSDTNEKKILKDDAYDRRIRYIYLRNCDKKKYRSVNTSLIIQFSMGNDQYPRSVTAMTDVLSNHKYNNWFKTKLNPTPSDKTRDQEGPPTKEVSFTQKQLTWTVIAERNDTAHVSVQRKTRYQNKTGI